MIYIGIDPGVTGAFAALCDGGTNSVGDIPVLTITRNGRKRTEPDALMCADALRESGDESLVAIEVNQARPVEGRRDSLISAHRMGMNVGVWLGICAALRRRVEMVYPQQWKRWAGLIGADKEASRALALRRWPMLADGLSRKKDHNRAEALLIADYARAKFGTGTMEDSRLGALVDKKA